MCVDRKGPLHQLVPNHQPVSCSRAQVSATLALCTNSHVPVAQCRAPVPGNSSMRGTEGKPAVRPRGHTPHTPKANVNADPSRFAPCGELTYASHPSLLARRGPS